MTTLFQPNAESDEFRDTVRAFCADVVPEAEVRRIMETDTGFDATLWRRIADELGAFGLAAPEGAGGLDMGLATMGVVVEEFGAALLPGPVVGTLGMAIPALAALNDPAIEADLLANLVAGERCAAFVADVGSGMYVPDRVLIEARESATGWVLSGTCGAVYDAGIADVLLVPARTADGDALFLVETDAAGCARAPIATMDLTRRQARVVLTDCPARLLAQGHAATAAISHAYRVGTALVCAEQVGAAARIYDLTAAYIAERVQFGRTIGSFQAIKHRAADLLVMLEHARSLAMNALWMIDAGHADVQLAISEAKAHCSEAFYRIAAGAIQLHGGIGFTWEHPTHLYFKRAVSDQSLLGSAERHRELIARLVLDGARIDEAMLERV